jgi:uncharacterized surface protein with fasciclin (FAS1) repeats
MKAIYTRMMGYKTFSKCVAALVFAVGLSSCSGSSGNAGTEIEFTNGSFTETLVEAQITSLFAQIYGSVLPTLSTEQVGGKTLFAPNNAAIEKYLTEKLVTIEELIAQPEVAAQLVLGHLFERTISATELLNMNGEPLVMLNGSTFTIDTSSGPTQLVNGDGLASTLIAIDLVSTDGVVHLVDAVLQP